MQTFTDKPVLSPRQLAEYLGISESKARRLIRTGEIPGFKVGALTRVRRADVDSYMMRRIKEDSGGY